MLGMHPVVDLHIPESVGGLQNVQTLRMINAVIAARDLPFFDGRLDSIDIDRVHFPDEWGKIPLMGPDDLGALKDEVFHRQFCRQPNESIVEHWQTAPGGRIYPRAARDVSYAMISVKRALLLSGLAGRSRVAVSMPFDGDPLGHLMARCLSQAGAGAFWAGADAAAQQDSLSLLCPDGWVGSAELAEAIQAAAAENRLDPAGGGVTHMLSCTGGWRDGARGQQAKAWGAQLRDCFWDPQMMMVLGCEDDECYGYRFWSDLCLPEVLDPETLSPVIEGTPGLLVLTALATNHVTPFLRWNTGQTAIMRSRRKGRGVFDVFPVIQLV